MKSREEAATGEMGQDALRTSGSGGGLPTTAVSNGGGRGRGLLRGWQVQNTSINIKIMILCGFVTILVLLGTVSFGNLGSSNADAVNQNLIKETEQILAESPSASVPTDLEELPKPEANPPTDLEEPPIAEVNPPTALEEPPKPEVNPPTALEEPANPPTDLEEPPKAEVNPNVTYTLGPRITNWDSQRKVWLSQINNV